MRTKLVLPCIAILLLSACQSVSIDRRGEKLAPGTAEVLAAIADTQSESDFIVAELKIIEVTGYGPSTTPVALNSILFAAAYREEVIRHLANIKKDSLVQLVLRLNHGGVNEKAKYNWEVQHILNN